MDKKRFKDLLEEHHTWPCEYTFKFIVPKDREQELEKILAGHNISKKNSKKGNYLSVTSKKNMDSTLEIMEIYEKASQIKGVISL